MRGGKVGGTARGSPPAAFAGRWAVRPSRRVGAGTNGDQPMRKSTSERMAAVSVKLDVSHGCAFHLFQVFAYVTSTRNTRAAWSTSVAFNTCSGGTGARARIWRRSHGAAPGAHVCARACGAEERGGNALS